METSTRFGVPVLPRQSSKAPSAGFGCSEVMTGGGSGQGPRSPPWAGTREDRRRLVSEVCAHYQAALGLQSDSVRNQCEHVEALWESFMARHCDNAQAALLDLHRQLLRTQRQWEERVWRPLWGASERPPEDAPREGPLRDVCLFLLLWGELGNLRFCPELICFLFAAAGAYCCAQPVSEAKRPGDFLAEVVRPIFTVMLDETFEPGDPPRSRFGAAPAPARACNYDDWNELFWDPSRLTKALYLDNGRTVFSACGKPVDLWPSLRSVDWPRSFKGQKSHREVHCMLPLLIGCYRIFALHSLTFGIMLMWATERYWGGWGFRSSLGLIAPAWMTLYEFGFQSISPAMACWGRIRGTLELALFYWLPAYTFACVMLQLSGWWFFPVLEIGGILIDLDKLVIPGHMTVSVLVSLSALLARPAQRRAWGRSTFAPELAGGRAWAAAAFWLAVLCCKLYFDSRVIVYCGAALHGVYRRHLEEVTEGAVWLLGAPMAVILLPATICCFASMPFFTQAAIAFIGTGSGVIRLGGLRTCCYRRGWGFGRLPERTCNRVLQMREAQEETAANAQPGNWWAQLSGRQLAAFVDTWNTMLHELRERDLLSDDELRELRFESVEAARHGPPNIPRLLNAQDVFSANALPANKEAARRVVSLARSVQMEPLPRSTVREMPTLTVLVPHFSETILFGNCDLFSGQTPTEMLNFLTHYYRGELGSFLERVRRPQGPGGTSGSKSPELQPMELEFELCRWASLRMQTLWRTVEGICRAYEHALSTLLKLQEPEASQALRNEAVHDKLQVVVAVQQYAKFADPDSCAYDVQRVAAIEAMMETFGRSLCIAYIEEEKTPRGKRYYSCLVDSSCPLRMAAAIPRHSWGAAGGTRVPKFRIELPGYPILGHGKSDNQNCALPFARGEILQMIDANQDAYFESSLFLPMALQEFSTERNGRRPGILGFREHIFSNVGLLGKVAADLEFAFGTIVQRTMDWPLEARLHYGHPDMMDKLQMLQQGGVSKATKGLNLSEDIFAGIDLTLRGGWTAYREYFEVGKGRDMGFMSVMAFYAKVSRGNGEQAITRQWLRLGLSLPMHRLLGVFYTHVGFFLNQYLVNAAMKSLAFMAAFFTLSDLAVHPGFSGPAVEMASQYFTLFYLLFVLATMLPFLFEAHIEHGLRATLKNLASALLRLYPVFAAFQSKLMGYHFVQTCYFGGAQYVATGRGLGTSRESFVKLFRSFAASHMNDGFEAALFLAFSFGICYSNMFYLCMAVCITSWTVAPFCFNPRQFDAPSLVAEDCREWLRWLSAGDGGEDRSWTTWAVQLQESRRSASRRWLVLPSGRLLAVLCTISLVIEAFPPPPFEPSARTLQYLLKLLPPFWHLVPCLVLSLVTLRSPDNLPANSMALLAGVAVAVTIAEVSAMEWEREYLDYKDVCVLFHKYISLRFLLEAADCAAIVRGRGCAASAFRTTCRLWALSLRFVRDVLLGITLLAFCLLLAALPGASRLHGLFLYRTVRRGEARERLLSDEALESASFDAQGASNAQLLDFLESRAPQAAAS